MNRLLLLPPPRLDHHQSLTPRRLRTTSMLTDVDDCRGRRMKSALALVMVVTFMATLVLDVSAAAGQTATDIRSSSRGEALWSWSDSDDAAGQELSDSMELSPSSENEFLLQLSSDTNWTSFLNETEDDDDQVEEDQDDEVEDAVIFDEADGDGNGTNWWTSPVYPSGYTPLGLVIASIFVTFIMIIIVGGNILVIIAIATERSLKGIQNWFIGSLAVADCLLGAIIMPFSLANEMMGYWVFGQWWCDVHSAVDVLLCTSSIMNLCLISLDRYWSITHAIEYLRKRTPERCVIMITTVWILSGLVSIPPLLGWKKETPQGEFPKCELSEDIGYVLYSALGSFYIPSCIMVFVYIRIYYAARARARRSQENKIKRKLSQTKEQQLEQQQQRRLSKQKAEMQQQQQQQQQKEELEMKPIKVAVLAGTDAVGKDHQHSTQQSVIANKNGNAQGDRSLPAPVAPSSRGSLTNIKPLPDGHHHQQHRTISETADIRRHSLSIGDVGLRNLTTNWGPSLSVDRLSVFDGCRTTNNKPRNGFKVDQPFRPSPQQKASSNAPSAAPSLTAINESSSSTGDDQCQKQLQQPTDDIPAEGVALPPAAQRPSSLKNGGDRTTTAALGTRHCVTFECLTVESSSVTYSTVKCFSGDQQPQPIHNNKVEPEPTAMATICEQQAAAPVAAVVPPVPNKRTPLLGQKPRSRFEKLARRILATGLAEGSAPAETSKMNSSSTYEWSSATNDDDHHLESPSPINASDNVSMMTDPAPPTSGGKTCASASASAASAASNHKTLRSSGSHDLNNENDMASDGGLDPSSSDSGTLARCTVVRPLKIRFCRPNSGSVHKKSSKAKRQVIDTGRVVVREKDPARERRRISRQREKRATLILGLIMGAFIACWLPFFFLYLLAPVCPSCNIQPWGFAFAFWLGYINSALNPVIYTIFNKDFRRAFRRILFRCTIAHY